MDDKTVEVIGYEKHSIDQLQGSIAGINCGINHIVFLLDDGKIHGLGSNNHMQLQIDKFIQGRIFDVSTGDYHTSVL